MSCNAKTSGSTLSLPSEWHPSTVLSKSKGKERLLSLECWYMNYGALAPLALAKLYPSLPFQCNKALPVSIISCWLA